jgi:RHH-type transcriptional regulator, proline utilization regulon repressor / proline dehydrogenase / delta 1-pyrroline-5-carboxylate dehydrogenase
LRMCKNEAQTTSQTWADVANVAAVQSQINAAIKAMSLDPLKTQVMAGPTGETNTLTASARPPILCLGPGETAVQQQVKAVEAHGGVAVAVNGTLQPDALTSLTGFSGVLHWGQNATAYGKALAKRSGPILPLITTLPDEAHVLLERHLCVDTTAAGGNAALMSGDEPIFEGDISEI